MKMNKKLAWFEENTPKPTRIRNYYKISLKDFEKKVLSYDEELTNSIYSGDVYIINGVVDPKKLHEIKAKAIEWGKQRQSTYEPMVEGAKDFHQVIQEGVASEKYAIKPVRHSYFFFRWNDDPLDLFHCTNHIWGLVKTFGGFPYNAYVSNTPIGGVVDRAQIAHYPPGAGMIPRHSDPFHNQKLILGVYISKYGKDFKKGGIYFVDKTDKDILLEPEINPGDAVVAYATITHGVACVDPDSTPDWNTPEGRWFLGLYSNDSNEKK